MTTTANASTVEVLTADEPRARKFLRRVSEWRVGERWHAFIRRDDGGTVEWRREIPAKDAGEPSSTVSVLVRVRVDSMPEDEGPLYISDHAAASLAWAVAHGATLYVDPKPTGSQSCDALGIAYRAVRVRFDPGKLGATWASPSFVLDWTLYQNGRQILNGPFPMTCAREVRP